MKNIKTSWDFSEMFASDDDPKMDEERKEIEKESQQFVAKWEKREDYLKDPKVLAEAMGEYEHWVHFLGTSGKQGFYIGLRTSLDQTDPKLRAKENKIDEFARKIMNEMQFFELRIAQIDEKLQPNFLNTAELQPYRHFLEKIFRQKKHNLTEAEEKIMTLQSKTSYGNWTEMVSSILSKQEREVLTPEGKKEVKPYTEFYSYMWNQDKKVRNSAGKAIDDVVSKLAEVSEHEINSILEYKKVNDDLRHFDRPDSASHLKDDIETEVVDALILAVTERFDISQKFFVLMAKLLGQKRLSYYDRVVPYGKIDKKYSFEESAELVGSVFDNLDPKFGEIFRSYVAKGQVDVFPKKGKRSGAFCSWNIIVAPTYILLNHTEKLNDVLTIAHEFGHGINSELMRESQNALNFDSPLSVTEVASTFMEDFVLQEIMKQADDELRLALMVMKLQEDIGTIFRQVALYNFETEMHREFREKGYLSKEDLGKIFKTEMQRAQGDGVEMHEGSENWWVQWHHIRYFFYVYSYASGLLISKALQGSVKKDPKFINKVKEFLAAGSSKSPKEIFADLGINIADPEFWKKGILEIEELLKETELLAKKLKKI